MDIFDMAEGLAKLELIDLYVSTTKDTLNDLKNVKLDEEQQVRLKMMLSLAASGAVFKV